VITLGRMADRTHVRASGEELARAGVEVVRTTRGGDVTYHGPGQLVVYPILDLTRRSLGTRRYVRELLGCVQRTLVSFGVDATLHDRRIGVFVDDGHGPPAKVAALGVSVSRGITGHGVAVNVSTDPEDFGLIVPCGSTDTGVTSLHRLLERPPGLGEVADRLVAELRSVFGGRLRVRPSGSAGRSAHDGVLPSPKTR
jgi:lipoate-protein ligase B